MNTLESMWFKKKKLPQSVASIPPQVLKLVNNNMLQSPIPSNSKRGKYNGHKITKADRLSIAKYASEHGVANTCKYGLFAQFNLKPSTVRGWMNTYSKNKSLLGRAPKTPKEAGLTPKKRGRRSCLGDNKSKIIDYLKRLRKAGTDINYYTTAAAIKSYLVATKQSYILKENGGWVDHYNRALIRELWKKLHYGKRKKCRKRRGKLNKNAGYIAARYKLRCKLMKKKYNIPDCLDMNYDETKLMIVPGSKYTMDEKGKKDIKGEKLDDKRCVTGFCGGARTGEAAKLQYINKGKFIHILFLSISLCKDNMINRHHNKMSSKFKAT